MSTLYIVATPIGNLEDTSIRSLRVLKEVDFIIAEDTRQTKKLLDHYHIQKPILSLHEHSSQKKLGEVLALLSSHDLAYVVDAGTPGVSDPGAKLINAICRNTGATKLRVVPIPGPSALSTLLSIADIPVDRFLFLGFLPKKKRRKTLLNTIATFPYPVVFFESPYRVVKTLEELRERGDFYTIVGRELTKKFETVYRGSVDEVLAQLKRDNVRGEFTILVKNQNAKTKDQNHKAKIKNI